MTNSRLEEWKRKRGRDEADEEEDSNEWKAKSSKNEWGEKSEWKNWFEDGKDTKNDSGWQNDKWKTEDNDWSKGKTEDGEDTKNDKWTKQDNDWSKGKNEDVKDTKNDSEWKSDNWGDNDWGTRKKKPWEEKKNCYTIEHGSEEWKYAVENGEINLRYEPGDEKLARVGPGDFRYFSASDAKSWAGAPKVVLQSPSFWVFGKNVNWVCSNIDAKSVRNFQVGLMTGGFRTDEDKQDKLDRRVDGSLPCYVIAQFGKQYPFVCENTENFNTEDLQSHGKVKAGYAMLHRLDRETSGAVLVAKNQQAFERLVTERDNHNWHKEYIALMHGKIPPDKWKGVIDVPLRRFEKKSYSNASFTVDACNRCRGKNKQWQCRDLDEDGYKCMGPAKSYYEVVKYFTHVRPDTKEKLDFTLVRVKLVSGKTHQIRVHMKIFCQESGLSTCGLVSDFKYLKGNADEQYRYDAKHFVNRVFLHEAVLGFRDPDDPFKNQVAKFPLPEDLSKVLKKFDENEEAMSEMLAVQEEMKKTKVGFFATEFMLNHDAEQNLRNCYYGAEEVIDAFMARCTKVRDPHDAKKVTYNHALRSFNGDHSAMVDRIVDNMDKETLKELLDREFPEATDHEDDANLPLPPGWERVMSRTTKKFFYFNKKLGKNQILHPGRALADGLPLGWKKVQSKRDPSVWYYLDTNTMTSHMEPPRRTGGKSFNPPDSADAHDATSSAEAGIFLGSLAVRSGAGKKVVVQQAVDEWVKKESTRHRGRFYYRNDFLDKSNPWHPLGLEPLPAGWRRIESGSTPGKYFFQHPDSNQTQLAHPSTKKTWLDVPEPWVCKESSTKKGMFYFVNKNNPDVSTTKHPLTGKHVVA